MFKKMERDGRVAPSVTCADIKISLGQDAEGSSSQPQQRPFNAIVTPQCESIKNVLWNLAGVAYTENGIVFLVSLQRTWSSAHDIYCSGGTKVLLSLQKSIFYQL